MHKKGEEPRKGKRKRKRKEKKEKDEWFEYF